MGECNKQATDFLNKVRAKMSISLVAWEQNRLWNEDFLRPKYRVTIHRKGYNSWAFTFWGNIRGDRVTEYDVLACLVKDEVPEYVEDFAKEYGYDYNPYEDSKEARRVERIHRATQREYEHVKRLFGDTLDELREIQ